MSEALRNEWPRFSRFGAQLAIVVDLAVEDYCDALVFVEYGLFAGYEIDNARRRMPSPTR